MDSVTFDRLSRALVAASPRRQMLRLLGAAPVAAGLLAALGDDDASAGPGAGAGVGSGHGRRRKRHRNHHRRNRNDHPPQQHKECKSNTGRLLSNGTCVTPCEANTGCPLAADACHNDGSGTAGACQGSNCCTLGVDYVAYCSPGELTSTPCTTLAGCPKGQFCAQGNTCRVACTAL